MIKIGEINRKGESMRDRILGDLKSAMKNQDKETLSVIRMVKGAIQMEELNNKGELNDDEIINIISKQIKTRKESILEFSKGGRDDLVEKTENEIKILEKYLPEQLTKEEVVEIINAAFEEVKPEGIRDMGKLMGIIKPKTSGKYDMGEISKLIKEKLNK